MLNWCSSDSPPHNWRARVWKAKILKQKLDGAGGWTATPCHRISVSDLNKNGLWTCVTKDGLERIHTAMQIRK